MTTMTGLSVVSTRCEQPRCGAKVVKVLPAPRSGSVTILASHARSLGVTPLCPRHGGAR